MAIPGGQVTAMEPFDQMLASFPDQGRKATQGDGTEPGGTAQAGGGKPSQQPPMSTADERATGEPVTPILGNTLADATDAQKFQTVEALVRSQDILGRNRWAIDSYYDWVRAGIAFGRLEKIPNVSMWVSKLPNGMTKESAGATPNKADDLCNKIEDTLMADPPKPDPQPHVQDEAAKAGAQLAAEFLLQDGGEAGTNDVETYRWAINNALSRTASILHYMVDKTGGGYQPLQKLSHKDATDPRRPMFAMVPSGPPDPATGIPAPMIEEEAVNPILRYVSAPDEQFPGGQFVETAEQADRVWLPKLVIERLRRENVRFIPANSTPETCQAMILLRWNTLADGRRFWPATVGQMDQTKLTGLSTWKPAMSDAYVVPFAFRALAQGNTGPSLDDVGSLSPLLQKRMFSYRIYVKASPEYPKGYWADVSGTNGGTTLDEGDLEYVVTLPSKGKTPRCRDIPATMVRPQMDVRNGDPTGWPVIARFAGASEAEATLWAAALDRLDNELHPHVYLRSTTAIDDDDWADRTRPIIMGPQDQEPTYERFTQFPPVLELVDRLDIKQDTSSGLTAAGQGLDSNNAVSGIAKNLTIQQAKVFLSSFQQNLLNAMVRGWRIKCQLAQAEFTTPQLLEFAGENASSQPRWWTGEDFAGVDRIGVQPGTGTMMTPEGKANYVAFMQGQQWMAPDQAAEVALPGIRMDLGIPENPVDAALERSVGAFLEGPPKGWLDAKKAQMAQVQAAQQAYQVTAQNAHAMGQPVPAFQPPPMAPLPNPFQPRPNDDEPAVALATVKRLSKLMFDPQYSAKDPMWQSVVNDRYMAARTALQPPPQLPHGVTISAKGDPPNIAQEEQAALQGMKPAGGNTPAAPASPPPVRSATAPPRPLAA